MTIYQSSYLIVVQEKDPKKFADEVESLEDKGYIHLNEKAVFFADGFHVAYYYAQDEDAELQSDLEELEKEIFQDEEKEKPVARPVGSEAYA